MEAKYYKVQIKQIHKQSDLLLRLLMYITKELNNVFKIQMYL